MLIGDKWIAIPHGKLQYRTLEGDTGETAGGHWCGAPDESGLSFFTYCAILPPSTALLDEHAAPSFPIRANRTLVNSLLDEWRAARHIE